MWCPHFKIWTKPAKSLRKSVCYLYWAKFVHPSKPIAQHYACQIGIGALMLTLQPELRINNSDDNVCYSLCSNKIWKLACLLPDYGLLNIMLLAYLFFLFYSLSLLIPFFLRSSWKVCIHLLKRRREKNTCMVKVILTIINELSKSSSNQYAQVAKECPTNQ